MGLLYLRLCRYATTAAIWSGASPSLGMMEPGLRTGGSWIHLAISSGVFGYRAPASEVRVPTWVRLGPIVPGEIPAMVWHATQPAVKKTCLPLPASEVESGSIGGRFCAATQASKSSRDWTMSFIRMLACETPQNSAHWPGNVPIFSGVNHIAFVCVGMTSRFPPIAGNQKLWMTSAVWREIATGCPIGTCSSLAVVMSSPGYWNSHHH